jgi:hypothetical protein
MKMIDEHIKKNYPLLISSFILIIYSILELGDVIVLIFIILGIFPNFYLFIGNFIFSEMHSLMVNLPIVYLPIFLMFTLMRIFSGIGLLRNREWAYFLSIISTIITMIIMIYFLPISAIEGLICAILLILLLIGRFGKKKVIMD